MGSKLSGKVGSGKKKPPDPEKKPLGRKKAGPGEKKSRPREKIRNYYSTLKNPLAAVTPHFKHFFTIGGFTIFN